MYSDDSSPLARIQRKQLERLYRQLEAAYEHQSRSSGVDRVRAQEDINQLLVEIHELQAQLPQNNSAALESASFVQTDGVMEGAQKPLDTVVGDQETSPPLLDESELRSVHLVVAAFWQTRTPSVMRVQSKMCYRDRETKTPLIKSLVEETYSVKLEDFPKFLDELVDRAICELPSLLAHEDVWLLTVDLFVPFELIRSPLSVWRDRESLLLRRRPLVIGCSDRFTPDQSAISKDLYNQMNKGWQRFQNCVPDGGEATLQALDWLESPYAEQESFEDYSGFKCFGDWFCSSDDNCLERWQDFVWSGIPLALWWCEGKPVRQTVERAFRSLTNGSRLDLLERIPKIREVQQRSGQGFIGVFFENPAYVPEVPKPYVWPST